jgi:beta-lactamase regulating signal transducer with metallopeptidase domain
MNAIEPLLRQPVAHAIAWALLQFVWQGALIGLVTAVALVALKRSAADVRYVVATIALSLMLTMPIVTAVQSWRSSSIPETVSPVVRMSSATVEEPAAQSAAVASAHSAMLSDTTDGAGPRIDRAAIVDAAMLRRETIEPWLPVLLLVWLVGVSLLTLRLVSGWIWIQHLRNHGAPADEGWEAVAARLSRRLHITRGVQLLESSLVEVPTVIGWIKPVILLPASVLTGLSPQQLEAILAHELAHIRRQDYIVNLLQTLVETLLFYHPAVWWLSRRIRVERENCCDDIAVSLCGDPYSYARALADLEERRGARHLALAANGGSLLQRVRRLLGAPTSHAGRGPGWLAGTAAVLVMGGIVAGALGDGITRAQQAPAEPPAAAIPAALPVAPQTPSIEPASASPVVPRSATSPVVVTTPATPTTPATEIQPAFPVVAVEPLDGRAIAAIIAPMTQPNPPLPIEPAIARTPPAIATTAPALAESVSTTVAVAAVQKSRQDQVGNFVWENNGEKLQVNYRGQIEFADDDTDVTQLSPGGYLKIKEGGRLGSRTVEFQADGSGNISRRYWFGTSERPFEPEGRQWLTKVLPRFIRQTGIGAPARVTRILKGSGPSGVLAEIGRIEGSWAKRIYFRELVAQATMDSSTLQRALAQAGREIESDHELASLLIEAADQSLADDGTRKAYFEAARSIESDFELRRVYSSALKRGTVTPAILAGILDATRSIDSDFELASLLAQIAKLQPLDDATRAPFFAALGTVGSDFEHRRVLSAVAGRGDLTPEIVSAMMDSALSVESDFELASLLTGIVERNGVEGAHRAPFFRAVESLESSFDRGRVLQALARRPDMSEETVLAILKAVQGMTSSHEASQVLLALARGRPMSGRARDLYIDAAEKLGDYEQGRVLTALVKNERRR